MTDTSSTAPIYKPLTDEKRKKIEEMFKKYDKDGSGSIDLKELRKMITDLGAQITQEEAALAMQQLDKDGNFSCNLEEFILFWTAKPGLGGYSSSVLDFMKLRLKAEKKLAKARSQLAKAKGKAVDEGTISIKGTAEISPGMAGVDPKMSMTFTTEKRADGDTASEKNLPKAVISVACESAEAATTLAKAADDFHQLVKEKAIELPRLPVQPKWVANGDKFEASLEVPAEMVEEMQGELPLALSVVESILKKLLITVSYGANADTVVENPNKAFVELVNGIKVTSDTLLDSGHLGAIELPPQIQAMLQMFAGSESSLLLGYNQAYAEKQIEKARKNIRTLGDPSWAPLPERIALFGPEVAQKMVEGGVAEMKACLEAGDSYGPFDKETVLGGRKIIKLLAGSKGVESIRFVNLPGVSVDFVARFEDVNPFKVAAYISAPVDQLDPNTSTEAEVEADPLSKKLEPGEEAKLKEVFNKYDKDGNGGIDLSELQAMCKELGGSLTEAQAKEAMAQLDTNKDGTCSFKEFCAFWTSKPELGGYSAMALQVLKMKLAAESALAAHQNRVMGLMAHNSRAKTLKEDLSANLSVEVTPGMTACPEKMKISAKVTQQVVDGDGDDEAPSVTLNLLAKSAEDAKKVVELTNQVLMKYAPPPLMQIPPTVTAEGATVSIVVSPPAEVAAGAMEEMEEVVSKAIQWVKTLKGAGVVVTMGSTFEDWLASPDSTVAETFGGTKIMLDFSASSMVRSLEVGGGRKKGMLKKVLKLFAGFEAKLLVGYNQKKIKNFFESWDDSGMLPWDKPLNEVFSPSGCARMMKKTEEEDYAEEMQEPLQTLYDVLKCLKGVESIVSKGILISPAEQVKAEAVINFENFNPFCIGEYFFSKVLEDCLKDGKFVLP
jgi:Ca2+-binding EF-hand superfamily protein